MTSLHTAAEGGDPEDIYNRMVSTRDGHSEKPVHQNTYKECEQVCATEKRAAKAPIDHVVRQMRGDPMLAPLLASHSNLLLREFAVRYLRTDALPPYVNEEAVEPLSAWLAVKKEAGALGPLTVQPSSCQVFTQFRRRFDEDKADCLKGSWRARSQEVRALVAAACVCLCGGVGTFPTGKCRSVTRLTSKPAPTTAITIATVSSTATTPIVLSAASVARLSSMVIALK